MSEEFVHRRKAFIGSYFGLLLGWFGLLLIAAGIAYALRELHVYQASWTVLRYWGAVAVAGTAAVYAIVMFALTWSFSRGIEVSFLPALAFAIWGAIPVVNVLPFVLLLLLASRRNGEAPAAEA